MPRPSGRGIFCARVAGPPAGSAARAARVERRGAIMPFHRLVAPLAAAFGPSRQPFAVAAIDDALWEIVVRILEHRLAGSAADQAERGRRLAARLSVKAETVRTGFDPRLLPAERILTAGDAGAEHDPAAAIAPRLGDLDAVLATEPIARQPVEVGLGPRRRGRLGGRQRRHRHQHHAFSFRLGRRAGAFNEILSARRRRGASADQTSARTTLTLCACISAGPKLVMKAMSVASRPTQMRATPSIGASRLGSTSCQAPPSQTSTNAWKSGGSTCQP